MTKTKSPTYRIWQGMFARCGNPKTDSFKYYGARGIKVCKRWLVFENFLADMGERPVGMSIDRFPNNDGDYKPNNCRWATPAEQMHNYRSNRLITFNGETLCLAEWAKRLGVLPQSIAQRLSTGMPLAEALTKPGKQNGRYITFNGDTLTLTEWGQRLGIDRTAVAYRLKRYPIDIALTAKPQYKPSNGLSHG